jgi:hypothetical protein
MSELRALHVNPCDEDLIPVECQCVDVLQALGRVWLSERNAVRDFYAHAMW